MKKEEFNSKFREYVKNNLSPTAEEQRLASDLYSAVKAVIGERCMITGSYARFTTVRPMHDLDILYVAGNFDPRNLNPKNVLDSLKTALDKNLRNPTKHRLSVLPPQSHSITISLTDGKEEVFSVDIVPAFISGLKNEFGDDVYYVPEIMNVGHSKRYLLYEEFAKTQKSELSWWIKSDPQGYITFASNLNGGNNDFRRSVKFVKKWKENCKERDEEFKLKSFHIEQIITGYFCKNMKIEIYDAVFRFFCDLSEHMAKAQIPDRADSNILIDKYVNGLTEDQRKAIMHARDGFLVKLEGFGPSSSIADLLNGDQYERHSDAEEFLFDQGIPILTDPGNNLKIDGYVKPLDGFSAGWLSETPQLQKGLTRGSGRTRLIKFSIVGDRPPADVYKWKVKNDNACSQPRGETLKPR